MTHFGPILVKIFSQIRKLENSTSFGQLSETQKLKPEKFKNFETQKLTPEPHIWITF